MPLSYYLFCLLKTAIVLLVLQTVAAYLVWFERKLIAHMQARWGPTKVGPFGLLQPAADAIKLLTKEDIIPTGVFMIPYLAAPAISMLVALVAFAVVPFGPVYKIAGSSVPFQISDINIGVLFLLSISSMGVYGIVLAGWASNSKYSLLGGLRSSAQMISYELSMSLSIVGVILLGSSLGLRDLVDAQAGSWWGFIPRWNIFPQIVGFFIFFTSALAETNRIPFDLPEAETELVAGYHTEYSSMKFAMFFIGEYVNMTTASAMATILYFGGWHGPLFGPEWLQFLLPMLYFCSKVFVFLFIYVWIRGTLPRFRYDQLMSFGWKFLVPLAITNLVITSLIIALKAH